MQAWLIASKRHNKTVRLTLDEPCSTRLLMSSVFHCVRIHIQALKVKIPGDSTRKEFLQILSTLKKGIEPTSERLQFSCYKLRRWINCIFSFGYFPGVKLQLADFSEPCISSIFKGWVNSVYTQPLKMELIQGSETSANYNLTPGKYLEENIQY